MPDPTDTLDPDALRRDVWTRGATLLGHLDKLRTVRTRLDELEAATWAELSALDALLEEVAS